MGSWLSEWGDRWGKFGGLIGLVFLAIYSPILRIETMAIPYSLFESLTILSLIYLDRYIRCGETKMLRRSVWLGVIALGTSFEFLVVVGGMMMGMWLVGGIKLVQSWLREAWWKMGLVLGWEGWKIIGNWGNFARLSNDHVIYYYEWRNFWMNNLSGFEFWERVWICMMVLIVVGVIFSLWRKEKGWKEVGFWFGGWLMMMVLIEVADYLYRLEGSAVKSSRLYIMVFEWWLLLMMIALKKWFLRWGFVAVVVLLSLRWGGSLVRKDNWLLTGWVYYQSKVRIGEQIREIVDKNKIDRIVISHDRWCEDYACGLWKNYFSKCFDKIGWGNVNRCKGKDSYYSEITQDVEKVRQELMEGKIKRVLVWGGKKGMPVEELRILCKLGECILVTNDIYY